MVQEKDVFALAVAEELRLEPKSGGGAKFDLRKVARVRVTSHRIIWHDVTTDTWLALRLDNVAKVEDSGGGFMRSPRITILMKSGLSILIKCGEESIKESLMSHMQQAISAAGWAQGSYEVAAMGGLKKVLAQREAKMKNTGEVLDAAVTDLESLKQHATRTVAAARQLAAAEGTANQGVAALLNDFGLLNSDGTAVVAGGESMRDIEADVERVCEAALERRGGLGMLLAHDAFCLVNRARGTALVSPDEVMQALRRLSREGGKLRLRQLGAGAGALAVSLSRTSDAETDAQLLSVAESVGPLSATRLGTELGLTTSEAQYLLRDAERRSVLVRDDAFDGCYYYRNFFDDF